ncbi:MAG: HAD-IA family hydrolase [Rhodospirillales bacterium]|nr:HAD-IA family hydrolase [Rhodospirillales bacterium]MBO6786433.1 HAD-IA family hydrolase [Rhodospirillales bacterium]
MASTVKLAVFDCDGTLVDSQHAINSCMTDAFVHVGLVPPAISHVRRVVGLPLAQAIEILADAENAPIPDMVEAYSISWQRMRHGGKLDEPLFDGTRELLTGLHTGDWTLGVATGKSMRGLEATLAHHALDGFFSTLQTADRARGKPHPEMLEFAMAETAATPDETVMIGDTTYDMEMAVNAGVRALGVAWGYHAPEDLRAAGAVEVVETVADLGRYLRNLKEQGS